MGLFVGNFLAMLIIVISLGFGHQSLELATWIYGGLIYAIWLIFLIRDFIGRPGQKDPFCSALDEHERRVYRRYHVAIDDPLPGQVYSGILNFLRVAGVIWAGVLVYKTQYVYAGVLAAYFILSASLIHRFNPWFFLGQQAEKGHKKAREELAWLNRVFTFKRGEPSETNPAEEHDDNEDAS